MRSTIIPPRLTDPQQFHYCTDSNPGTGADDAFVLKRGVCAKVLQITTIIINTNLKQNEAQSAHAESTHKGVN